MVGTAVPAEIRPRTPGEFVRELRRYKILAGNPTLLILQRMTGVPRSTLSDALNPRRTTLPQHDLVRRLVMACGASPDEVRRWQDDWCRIQAASEVTTTHMQPASLVPRHVPLAPGGFVPRERESSDLDTWAAGTDLPVAVLAGAAGTGKSSLAEHWAHRCAARFPGGQLYVDLAGVAGLGDAAGRLLGQLGVPHDQLPSHIDSQINLYHCLTFGRQVLVLLDNASGPDQVRPLLPRASSSRTLITSRHRCTSLVVREGARRITIGPLTPAQVQQIAGVPVELAGDLDGHPLALRHVAARLADRPYLAYGQQENLLADLDGLWESWLAGLSGRARLLLSGAARSARRRLSTRTAAGLLGIAIEEAAEALTELYDLHMMDAEGDDGYVCHGLLWRHLRVVSGGPGTTPNGEL